MYILMGVMERKKTLLVYTISSILILGIISPSFTFEPAFATPIIYGINGGGGNPDPELFTINPLTGVGTVVVPGPGDIDLGNVIGLAGCGAIDFDPNTGILWGICEDEISGAPMLITINLSTGAGTKVADISGSLFDAGFFRIFDMSFRNDGTSTIYVSARSPVTVPPTPHDVDLHTMDLAGFSTLIGTSVSPANGGNGLAFSSGNTLYLIDNSNVYEVNPGTAATSNPEPVSWSPSLSNARDNAMDFVPGGVTLYSSTNDGGAGSGPNYLSTVNTVTGLVTQVGLTLTGLDAIAVLASDENEIHAQWDFQQPGIAGPGDIPPTDFEETPSIYFLDDHQPTLNCDPILPAAAPNDCVITLPNFIDPLPFKSIEVDILFDQPAQPLQLLSATCYDDPSNNNPIQAILQGQEVDVQNPNLLKIEFLCDPNPDWETIHLQFLPLDNPQNPKFVSITVWTDSFDAQVGGTDISINTSALLLAGVESVSMWMIPVVIAGIGIGIFVIKRRN